jgi:hypothetical protein
VHLDESGVGCSVKSLSDLGNPMIKPMKRFRDSWSKTYYWDIDYHAPEKDVYEKNGSGVDSLRKYIKEMDPTGLIIFADNETKNRNGSKLAKWLRECGYRVDESSQYVNENHLMAGDSKKYADKCVLYTWYWQRKEPKREEKLDETASTDGVRSKRHTSGSTVRIARRSQTNQRPKTKAPIMGSRAPKRKAA